MAVQSPSFPLGIVVITPNALDQLAPADVQRGIQRHQAGDAPAVRGQTTEVGQQKPDDGRQRTEDRGRRAEGGRWSQPTDSGFCIIFPSFLPMLAQTLSNSSFLNRSR
jgi:hypothetical protein